MRFVRSLVFATLAGGVKFDTCEETFCKELRDANQIWTLEPSSVSKNKNEGYNMTLKNCNSFQKLNLDLEIWDRGIIRLGFHDHVYRYRLEEGLDYQRMSRIDSKYWTHGNSTWIKTGNLTIEVASDPFRIHMYQNDQNIVTINGHDMLFVQDSGEFMSVGLDISGTWTHLYGIPEHASQLCLRSTVSGEPYRLYNLDVLDYKINSSAALYGSVPFVVGTDSTGNWNGMFWMNPSQTWVDIDYSKVHWMSESGSIEMVILTQDTLREILDLYTQIVGRSMMPPLFAVGYHQSRWSYMSQEQILDAEARFEEHDIPVDVFWLDIEHTRGRRYFTWNDNFPNPSEMLSILASHGRYMVAIADPHIKADPGYGIYTQAKTLGLFVKDNRGNDFKGECWPGQSSWIDFFNPEARKYWGSLFGRETWSIPTLFVWNDMNEPSVFKEHEITFPKHAVHSNGWRNADVHNLYGHYMVMATYEGLVARSRGTKRPFVLSRSFFSGTQKYAAVWTGDNKASWEDLQIMIPMVLSCSVAGIGFTGADVGGFFGDPDPELLVRWYQASSLLPFFRAHSHIEARPREPYLFDSPWKDPIVRSIRLRYQLLPYIYTLFYECSINGSPVVRPLFFEFDDRTSLEIQDQFMLGPSLMCKPVTIPNAALIDIHFPGEQEWRCFHSFQEIKAIEMTVGLDTLPLFVRPGYIVPTKPIGRRSSKCMARDPYLLLVHLGSSGSAKGTLYLDDGESLGSEQYQYREFVAETTPSQVIISSRLVSGCPMYKHVDNPVGVQGSILKIIVLGISRVQRVWTNDRDLEFRQSDKLEVKLPLFPIDRDWTLEIE